MAPFTLSQTLTFATHTRALQVATWAAKHQLRAKGLRVSDFTGAQLRAYGEAYLAAHRAELIPEAKALVEQWRRNGFFGKRAAVQKMIEL
jgi:hypothetical protein